MILLIGNNMANAPLSSEAEANEFNQSPPKQIITELLSVCARDRMGLISKLSNHSSENCSQFSCEIRALLYFIPMEMISKINLL